MVQICLKKELTGSVAVSQLQLGGAILGVVMNSSIVCPSLRVTKYDEKVGHLCTEDFKLVEGD